MSTLADRRPAAISFLQQHGADSTPHLFGDLLSHLVGVEELVRAWGGDDRLALAALGHATYGTHGFEPHILELADRDQLRETIGPEAEAFVYFYASCDRDHFYPQLSRPDGEPGALEFRDRFTGEVFVPPASEVTLFVDLTYANEVELAVASPGGPASWSWLSQFVSETQRWASPGFFVGATALLQVPA
jgi:hypothetical protein